MRTYAIRPRKRCRNRRLYDAIDRWALGVMNNSPGSRAFYGQHRAAETFTIRRCVLSAIDSSESCTAACAATASTTNTPPRQTAKPPVPLDKLRPRDLYTTVASQNSCHRWSGAVAKDQSGRASGSAVCTRTIGGRS